MNELVLETPDGGDFELTPQKNNMVGLFIQNPPKYYDFGRDSGIIDLNAAELVQIRDWIDAWLDQ